MNRKPKTLAAAVGVLACLCVAAPAGAANPHPPYLNPTGPLTLAAGDYCSFPVQVEYLRSNEYIIHQSTGPDGTVTQQITGATTIQVTNETTGKSITYNASGPGTVIIHPDGSYSVATRGPSLFYTTVADSYLGVPAISYTTGPVDFSVASTGITTSYRYTGHQTDVCAALS